MCKNGAKYIKKRAAQAALVCKRVTRIELATTAWEAVVLPLNYTRMAVPTGFEPAISCVTGRHVNPYTTEPIAGAGLEPATFGL